MKKVICLILVVLMSVVYAFASFSAFEGHRQSTLTTSHDPTRRIDFKIEGERIIADLSYEREVKVFMPKIPTGTNHTVIRVESSNGDFLNYRVNYSNGWYFPVHDKLADMNVDIVESYEQTASEAVVQYLVGDTGGSVEETLGLIRTYAKTITADLNSDYDKARAISAWVADTIFYDMKAVDTEVGLETIALKNVLETRKTTCSGYANLTAAMLESIGIKAVTVIGNALTLDEFDHLTTRNNRHEWTAFWHESENRWVLLDSGWDSRNIYDDSGYKQKIETLRKYFDITPEALAQTHRAVEAQHRDYYGLIAPAQTTDASGTTPVITTTAVTTAAATQNSPPVEGELRANTPVIFIAIGLVTLIVVTLIVYTLKRRK